MLWLQIGCKIHRILATHHKPLLQQWNRLCYCTEPGAPVCNRGRRNGRALCCRNGTGTEEAATAIPAPRAAQAPRRAQRQGLAGGACHREMRRKVENLVAADSRRSRKALRSICRRRSSKSISGKSRWGRHKVQHRLWPHQGVRDGDRTLLIYASALAERAVGRRHRRHRRRRRNARHCLHDLDHQLVRHPPRSSSQSELPPPQHHDRRQPRRICPLAGGQVRCKIAIYPRRMRLGFIETTSSPRPSSAVAHPDPRRVQRPLQGPPAFPGHVNQPPAAAPLGSRHRALRLQAVATSRTARHGA
jgi:hypothetical protein